MFSHNISHCLMINMVFLLYAITFSIKLYSIKYIFNKITDYINNANYC